MLSQIFLLKWNRFRKYYNILPTQTQRKIVKIFKCRDIFKDKEVGLDWYHANKNNSALIKKIQRRGERLLCQFNIEHTSSDSDSDPDPDYDSET